MSTSPSPNWFRHFLVAALILTLFSVGFAHYALTIDDGYIAFRYSRNLVAGHGLVFNPGEWVEGYTQLLWILLIAGGMALGLDPEPLAYGMGYLAGLGVLALVARIAWTWSRGSLGWTWLPVLALCMNRTFLAWSSGGLGSQLFVLGALGSTWVFAGERERRVPWPWKSAALFGLTILMRPEGGLFAAVAGALFLMDVVRGRRAWGSLVVWSGCAGIIVGAHLIWRIQYYGDWLPNTFRAKVSGFWWNQGLFYGWAFTKAHLAFLLIPLSLGFRRHAPRALHLLLVQGLLYVVYVVSIGGDHFEFRFMTRVLPIMYLVCSEWSRQLYDAALAAGQASRARCTGITAAAIILVTAVAPLFLTSQEITHGVAPLERLRNYVAYRIEEGRFLRRMVDQGHLPSDTVIAVRGAGALPYFADLTTVDIHGLNDRTVAEQPLKERGVVAHEKWAAPEYLQSRRVAIVELFTRIIYPPQYSPRSSQIQVDLRHFQGPVRRVRHSGVHLAIGTTLSEEEFRRVFRDFEILP